MRRRNAHNRQEGSPWGGVGRAPPNPPPPPSPPLVRQQLALAGQVDERGGGLVLLQRIQQLGWVA